jgi:hypothetical protein
MSVLLILLWLFAFTAAVTPALGRWVFAWVLRIELEGDQLLQEWTQNLRAL